MDDSFNCPSCHALLRTGGNITPGSQIRCPQCSTVFAVPSPAFAAAPLPATAPYIPTSPASTTAAPPRPAPAAAPAPFQQDYRPLAPRRHAGGGGLKVGLILGGIGLVLGIVAILLWVWPGWLRSKDSPCLPMLVHVPKDSTLFAGADLDK